MNEQTETQNYLTKEEAAELLHVKPDTMNCFARQGRLPSHWIGKRRLFKHQDMLSFIEANRHTSGNLHKNKRTA